MVVGGTSLSTCPSGQHMVKSTVGSPIAADRRQHRVARASQAMVARLVGTEY